MYKWTESSYCRGNKVDVPDVLPDRLEACAPCRAGGRPAVVRRSHRAACGSLRVGGNTRTGAPTVHGCVC
eukprot:6394951-Pyramimonas_sp.AAC.1